MSKKRVLVIDTPNSRARTIALMQAYGAGQVKQGLVAGEYPVPEVVLDIETNDVNGDPMFTALTHKGTVTGRFSHSEPNFYDLDPQGNVVHSDGWSPDNELRVLEEIDLSEVEERVIAHYARLNKEPKE